MLLSKLRIVAALVLAAGLLAGGVGLFSRDAQAQRPGEPKVESQAQPPPAAPAPPAPASARDELARLQGTWVVISHARNGVNVPQQNFRRQVMTIQGDRMTFESDGKVLAEVHIRLDPSKDPKTLDSRSLDGRTTQAIYNLEGDRLTVCESPPGQPRPNEFVVNWNNSAAQPFLTVYRRQAVQTESEKLRGTWKLVGVESGGQSRALSSATRWVISETAVVVGPPDPRGDRTFSYRLNPVPNPKQIDFITTNPHTTSAAAAFKEKPAIYALEGRKLKVALGEAGRPTGFDSRGEDPKVRVFHFEREAADLDVPVQPDDLQGVGVDFIMPIRPEDLSGAADPTPRFWAAISISQPIFMQSELDRLQIHFCLSVEGDRTVNPKIEASKIIVNGKELPEAAQVFREANESNRTYFSNLPPGVTIHTVHNLGKYFREGGVYRVKWKGEHFESPEIMFRVSR